MKPSINKIRLRLVLIAFLPVSLFFIYATMVSFQAWDPGYAALIFGSLIVTATLFLLQQIRLHLLKPLDETIAHLHQFSFEGTGEQERVEGLNELKLAIDTYILEMEHGYHRSSAKLASELNVLKRKVSDLEASRVTSSNVNIDDPSADPTTLLLRRLCDFPVRRLLGFSKGLKIVEQPELNRNLETILQAAESLDFFIKELTREIPTSTIKEVEPWQLIDDVLHLLGPVLLDNQSSISVKINDSCPTTFSIAEQSFKSVLFNYLAHYFISREISREISHEHSHEPSDRQADLLLEVSFSPENDIILAIDNENFPNNTRQTARLESLLDSTISLEDGLLCFPAIALPSPRSTPGTGLTGIVICEGILQRESLHKRFASLGVDITSDFKTVRLDICIVEDETSEAFKAVQQYLNPDASIFLLNNKTLYHRPNWHQLSHPVCHQEIRQLLVKTKPASQHSETYEILAADDNEANLKLLELQLLGLGHQVTTATDGRDAVDLCQSKQFDLVFLDIQMPGMGGLEAARLIQDLQIVVPPIIGLSAHVTNEERQNYLAAGMSQIIVKPVRIEKLRSVLNLQINLATAKPPIPASKLTELVLFDRQYSLDVANGRATLADELFQILISNLQKDQDQINLSVDNNDQESLRRSVHKLNGAVKYCGVPRLASAIDKLENMVKTSSDDHVRRALHLLNNEVNALLGWYASHPSPFAPDTDGAVQEDLEV